MPYSIKKVSSRCWQVVNTETGEIHAKCSTKKNAEKQLNLLRGVEHGWKPSGSYRDFIKQHFKNRPAGTCVRAWMVEGAKKWREMKT